MNPFGYLLSQRNIEHEYVIRYRAHNDWYFVSIEEEEPRPVIWSPQIVRAFLFRSEQHVEEFKCDFLRDRPCDIIMLK